MPKTIPESKVSIFKFTKTKVVYDKPIYIDAQIVDLSNTLMYCFPYKYIYMKTKFLMSNTNRYYILKDGHHQFIQIYHNYIEVGPILLS